MSASDQDILRRAKLMIDQRDATAVEQARERAADLPAMGDRESADVWLFSLIGRKAAPQESADSPGRRLVRRNLRVRQHLHRADRP